MPVSVDIINCGSGSVGTRFDGCDVSIKNLTRPFLLSPKVKIDLLSGTITAVEVGKLIKKGLIVPLGRANDVKEAGAKNNQQTYSDKSKRTISQGLYEFMFDYEANLCFVKAMHKIKLKEWTIAFLDVESKWHFDRKNNRIQGFEINDINVENMTLNDGGSKTSGVVISIQLSQDGTRGFNERLSFMTPDVFDWSEVYGVQDVLLSNKTLSIANLVVTVLSGCDKSSPVYGLTTANFRVQNATTLANEAVTVVELGSGDYKITGATAGPRTIQLYDSVLGLDVADILNSEYFRSNIATVVLTT